MDTAQLPQIQGVVKSVETDTSSSKRVLKESCMPQKEQIKAVVLKCPRCNSDNTKFCYYNNYSLSQPRYLCKTCRRYWTVGGSLRNIPVGGNARKKNKRSSSSSYSSSCIISQSSSKKLLLSAAAHHASTQNLKIKVQDHECQHLNLGFSESSTISNDFKTISQLIQVPNFDNDNIIGNKSMQTISPNNSSSTSHDFSGLELSTGIHSSTDFNNVSTFLSMLSSITSSTNFDHPNPTFYSSTLSPSGLPLVIDHQLIKPNTSSATLHLSWDQNELGVSTTNIAGSEGKPLFPFDDLKVEASNNTSTRHDSNEQQNEGVIGTAGSW